MKHHKQHCRSAVAAALVLTLSGTAFAEEGFQVRYNLAGSLGGEMFAPPDQTGWAAGIAATHINVQKVTGGNGLPLTATTPAGSLPVPGLPQALYPTHGAGTVEIDGTGSFNLLNLAVGYITSDKYAGGRLGFVFNLPVGEKTQYFSGHGSTPTLAWSPAVPPAIRAATAAAYDKQYQAAVSGMAAAETGKVTGVGDAELQAGWLYVEDKLRVLAGASLVLPTGKYSSDAGPDIGTGNYYTLRPAVQAAYLVTPEIAFAGKVTLGLNTRNKDNDLRSGNWAGLELSVGYKTSVGVIGLHGIRVQQFQDDRNSPWGASRFRSTNAGAFFTTRISALNAALTLQYMGTTESHYAKHGGFTQLRLVRLF